MNEHLTFSTYPVTEWEKFDSGELNVQLSERELEILTSLNDKVSLEQVKQVYLPIAKIIDLDVKNYQKKQVKKQIFLNQKIKKIPFIIGVSGSVAVGKSTTSRLLQTILQQYYPLKKVELITTDGFLYENKILESKNIMHKKGFPESYNMQKLMDFLSKVKMGEHQIDTPVYSHEIYDIIPNQFLRIDAPDILIVEGINVLQLLPNEEIYASDFFDFKIYVDADSTHIETWFLERFELLMDKAKHEPKNFYYQFAIGDRQEAINMAKDVWKETNLVNLQEYILPTKYRADLIIHKGQKHIIDYIMLKKY